MPRLKRKGPTFRGGRPLRPEDRAVLRGEPNPAGGSWWRHFALQGCHIDQLEAAWEQHGAFVVAEWVAARPATRPVGWWVFDAPDLMEAFAFDDSIQREATDERRRHGHLTHRLSEGPPPDEARILREHNLLSAEELGTLEMEA